MDMDTRVAEFIEELEEQGYEISTEPTVNTSNIWTSKAFQTSILKGEEIHQFSAYVGEGWYSLTDIQAFHLAHEIVAEVVNYASYEAWNKDTFQEYEHMFGRDGAEAYYIEAKQVETAIHEALGEELFEQFYNLDQE